MININKHISMFQSQCGRLLIQLIMNDLSRIIAHFSLVCWSKALLCHQLTNISWVNLRLIQYDIN